MGYDIPQPPVPVWMVALCIDPPDERAYIRVVKTQASEPAIAVERAYQVAERKGHASMVTDAIAMLETEVYSVDWLMNWLQDQPDE